MKKYNYRENVENDVLTYINENYNMDDVRNTLYYSDTREAFIEKLNNALWVEDSVTGNASGSYTMNRHIAEEHICHNYDIMWEAFYEFGYTMKDVGEFITSKGAEAIDVTIRCYILPSAINKVIIRIMERYEIEHRLDI